MTFVWSEGFLCPEMNSRHKSDLPTEQLLLSAFLFPPCRQTCTHTNCGWTVNASLSAHLAIICLHLLMVNHRFFLSFPPHSLQLSVNYFPISKCPPFNLLSPLALITQACTHGPHRKQISSSIAQTPWHKLINEGIKMNDDPLGEIFFPGCDSAYQWMVQCL